MINHCAMYDCTRAKTQLSRWMQIKTFLDNINTLGNDMSSHTRVTQTAETLKRNMREEKKMKTQLTTIFFGHKQFLI